MGNQESDIDRNYQGSKDHAHYFKKNGEWEVINTVGGIHQEITARYGKNKYGASLYGTEGVPVDEGVSSWLDSLLG